MNLIREDSFEVFVLVASTGRELRITSDQGHGVRKKVVWIFVRLFARVQHDVPLLLGAIVLIGMKYEL